MAYESTRGKEGKKEVDNDLAYTPSDIYVWHPRNKPVKLHLPLSDVSRLIFKFKPE